MDEFRQWLREKYGSPENLSAAWRRPVASFDEAALPEADEVRRMEDLVPHLDWLRFRDAHERRDGAAEALEYLAPHARRDASPRASPPGTAPQAARAEPEGGASGVGLARRMYDRIRVAARARLTAEAPLALAETMPLLPPDAGPPLVDFAARAALMHGAAPGDAFPSGCDAATVGPLAEALRSRPWRVDRKILLLYPRVYAEIRRIAASLGGPDGSMDHLTFGFRRPIQIEGPSMLRRYVDLVARTRYSFALGDTRMALEAMRECPLIVCPTQELMDADGMTKFERYVLGGGFLALGPRIPFIDDAMRPNETLARHFGGALADFSLAMHARGDGAFFTLPGYLAASIIEYAAFESGLAKGLVADADGLDSAVHRSGSARLLFVANPSDYPLETTLSGEPLRRLRDLDTGEESPAPADLKLPLAPASVRAWEVL